MSFQYEYPRPAVTVDIIVITDELKPKILLIQRLRDPFKDCWALPGGFVDENEDLLDAAFRELKEETAIEQISLTQFKSYGTPGRDPRGHTVSVIYWGVVAPETSFAAGDDAAFAKWFELNQLPKLAFDHGEIVEEFIVMRIK